MPSPFPGMDPYLEAPEVWSDVHHELISMIRELLNRIICPKYVARVEERVYIVPDDDPTQDIEQIPEVEIDFPVIVIDEAKRDSLTIAEPIIVRIEPVREARVEIVEADTHDVVTVIEVLSPSNKVRGSAGHASFTAKRDEVLASQANWVEIDLLRDGTPHPFRVHRFRQYQHLVHSSPINLRPDSKNWPMLLTEPLQVVGIPLRDPDPDAPLALQMALTMAYDRAAYDATVNYAADPVPPLSPALAKWAKKLLKPKKRR